MKRAQKYVNDYFSLVWNMTSETKKQELLKNMFINFALEAIKEDRKNLIQYIKTVPIWGTLDEFSVLNAPIIDLK